MISKLDDMLSVMTEQTLTVHLPAVLDTLQPIEFSDQLTGIRTAIIERYQVQELPEKWDKATGFFVLLSPIDNQSHWKAYVDTINNAFKETVREADFDEMGIEKGFWHVALLFTTEDSDKPLSEVELAYMKVLLMQVFQTSPNVQVVNKPSLENDFKGVDAEYMRHVLQSVFKVLFVRGYRNSHLGAISRNLTEIHDPDAVEEISTLRKLQDWREQKARLNGRPASTLISNSELELIADLRPKTVEELQAIEGLSTITKSYYSHELTHLLND